MHRVDPAVIGEIGPGWEYYLDQLVAASSGAPLPDFDAYLRVLRALLSGEETELTVDGRLGHARFMNRQHGFVDLEHPIPLIVGANGPRALALAGELGDGLMTIAATRGEDIEQSLDTIRAGATKAGRELPASFSMTSMTNVVVLEPAELRDLVFRGLRAVVATGAA